MQLIQRSVQVGTGLDRLAVPAVPALDQGHALALDGAGENHGRAPGGRGGFLERTQDCPDVVTVDDDGMPAEGLPPVPVRRHVVAPLRRAALAESVHVGDGAQVVEPVAIRDLGRLPHRALCRLAVADQHVGTVVRADAAGVERDADRGANALTQRSGRHVDERQARRGVPFEIAVDPPQLQEIVRRHESRLGPGRVEQRRRVALGEHEAIVLVVLRIPRVESHVAEEERRDDIRGRAAARRMAAAGRTRGAHGGNAQSGRDPLQRGDDNDGF